VAWAESNAIVFANSVLGARTSRYGDFFDICAALTGRVPEAGLHVTEHRRAEVVFHVKGLSPDQLTRDILYPVLGTLIGELTGARVPVIVGLPSSVSEERLKALGAAAASAGSVGLFHVVGVTPEALDRAAGRPQCPSPIRLECAPFGPALQRLCRPRAGMALGLPWGLAGVVPQCRGCLRRRRRAAGPSMER
jgi:predicted aconitase